MCDDEAIFDESLWLRYSVIGGQYFEEPSRASGKLSVRIAQEKPWTSICGQGSEK